MTWLRIDDGFAEHEKLLKLPRSERWTWMEILCYCARQDAPTVPLRIGEILSRATPKFLDRCVNAGLLDCDEHGGLTVHDWHVYNPKDPTGALRQSRHRNAKRNAKNRYGSNASRVGARARPDPTPKNKPLQADVDLDTEAEQEPVHALPDLNTVLKDFPD